MLKVGLTGSIAVGKSFVARTLRDLGCLVLDADETSRRVVEPGTDGLREIVKTFGPGVLEPNGSLNRPALGQIVFDDESKRELLNSIVHPRVIENQNRWLSEAEAVEPDGIAVIDAALMIESGSFRRFDALIVVWCNEDVQLSRLIYRDDLTESEAKKRIAAQMPQDEKKKYTDLLIDTSNGYDDTQRQTEETFRKLKSLQK